MSSHPRESLHPLLELASPRRCILIRLPSPFTFKSASASTSRSPSSSLSYGAFAASLSHDGLALGSHFKRELRATSNGRHVGVRIILAGACTSCMRRISRPNLFGFLDARLSGASWPRCQATLRVSACGRIAKTNGASGFRHLSGLASYGFDPFCQPKGVGPTTSWPWCALHRALSPACDSPAQTV